MTRLANKDWSRTMTSAAAAIHGAVSYTDKKHLSLSEVMGYTGHAFRMNIDPKTINIAGPTSFPGGYIFRRNLCNLGFTSCLADPFKPIAPEKIEKVIQLVQDSIDRGIPAISVDLFIPEFGLIYGYDDDKQLFYAKDVSQDGTITYEQFANPRIELLFVVTISESLPHSKYEMVRMALDMIVDHARGREWTHVFGDWFAQGLAGYDAWIKVMERRGADEEGNSYNVAVVADAREHAVHFLSILERQWNGANIVERYVRSGAAEAKKHFAVVAEAFDELRTMFPFPQGGSPKDPAQADRAIELLKVAHEAEVQGIEALERLQDFMKQYYSEIWVN